MRKLILGCATIVGIPIVILVMVVILAHFGVTGPAATLGDAFDSVTGSSQQTLARVSSPDGQFVGVVTTTHSWDDVIGVGLESSDRSQGRPILGVTDRGAEEHQVSLQWTASRTLQITYSGRPDMIYFQDLSDWNGVHVVFVQAPVAP